MISRKDINGVTVLNISGQLDHHEVVNLKNEVNTLIQEHRFKLVLGLADVDRVDFLSLCVLVETRRELKARQGDLKLAALKQGVTNFISTVGGNGQLPTFRNVTEAARSYTR